MKLGKTKNGATYKRSAKNDKTEGFELKMEQEKLKIVYMGTPLFAVKPLQRLNEAVKILTVVTQPDRKGNRGELSRCCVAKEAERLCLPLLQYGNISKEGLESIKSLAPDVIVTCAYGQILSKEFLKIAPLGVINIHASLLPKYRGASPISQALLSGDKETGITIMKTAYKMDSGDILTSKSVKIEPQDNLGTLSEKLSLLAAGEIVGALRLLACGEGEFRAQEESGCSYCCKLTRDDEKIDWDKPAFEVFNKVRAFCPQPLAYTTLKGAVLKIACCRVTEIESKGYLCGEVAELSKKEILVAANDYLVALLKVKPQGGKEMDAASFINGRKIEKGQRLI